MDLREWDKKLLASSPDLGKLSADYFEKNNYGFTGVLVDEEGSYTYVGAAGLVRLYPGSWEGFVYTTNLFPRYGIQIHRIALRLMNAFFAVPSVRRIQANLDSTHPLSIRWAKKLGLKFEGIQEQYGPEGQDFHMYAKVKPR
jgi:RimJ/RimL family protein N-acetyltransferase